MMHFFYSDPIFPKYFPNQYGIELHIRALYDTLCQTKILGTHEFSKKKGVTYKKTHTYQNVNLRKSYHIAPEKKNSSYRSQKQLHREI